MIKPSVTIILFLIMFAGQALSQERTPPATMFRAGPHPPLMAVEGNPAPMNTPGERMWWEDPQFRAKLQLSDDQTGKIEKTVRDQQMRGIDLCADVEKQGLLLQRLMDSDTPNETQVLAQVDRLSEARARLEKSYLEMFFAVRTILTPDQAKNLAVLRREVMTFEMNLGPPEEAPPFSAGGPPE